MTTESSHRPSRARPSASDIADTVARLRATFATGRTRDLAWRKTQLRALEKTDDRERGGDRRRARARPRPQAVRGLAGRHRQRRRRGEGRREERPQMGAAQIPAAGALAAAGPRLGGVRAVRHRVDHRRVELPVRVDARPGGRCDRRRKHRGAQAVRGRSGVVAVDGRTGGAVPGQRRDRGRGGRRSGRARNSSRRASTICCSPAAPRSAARCTKLRRRT